jgi:mannosyl-3-phosphoglycerate synthase
MRIESIGLAEHLGSVKINGVRRVLELDSGARPLQDEIPEVERIEKEAIEDIERGMAIVLPIKDETLKVYEGVLSGVPHDCLMIVVSNSKRGGVDTFVSEQDILARFCYATKRQALIVHQKDPVLAEALKQADYAEILDEEGLVRDGKSEGMMIGILLAMLHGKDYVGFIDTDNYIPGSVLEYVQHYAISFALAKSPYVMARILWHYKPKIAGEIFFKKWGRVSEISNKYINHLLSTKKRFETEIIKTGNAGEHAMSMKLAKMLTYGSGYAVEVQELMSIFEQFGGILPITDKTAAEKGVEIVQTETLNPHLHEERGGEHLVQDMLLPSLSAIYHSPLCEPSTKQMIFDQLVEQKCLKPTDEVPRVRLIPPPQKADMGKFAHAIEAKLSEYSVPRGRMLRERFISAEFGRPTDKVKKVVFTDLDGSLLHPVTYSYAQALDALRLLQETEIPLVFCSAKTRAEQEVYRRELGVKDPFIVENGGAIFIPKDYFRLHFSYDKATKDYLVIELGIPYQEVRLKLKKAIEGETGCVVKGFGDMSVEEVARETGLSLTRAELAKQREYSETVKIEGNKKDVDRVVKKIEQAGLNCPFGGRFYGVTAGSDKGRAVKILSELFKLNLGKVMTMGIGDNDSDLPMLSMVDLPILVQVQRSRWIKLGLKRIHKVKGVGPQGWSMAIRGLVQGEAKPK